MICFKYLQENFWSAGEGREEQQRKHGHSCSVSSIPDFTEGNFVL
jgi:hypothetical protein